MIDAARERGIPVVVAGSDASDHPALYLDRGADAVVAGEGEVTLVEVLDALSGRTTRPLGDGRRARAARARRARSCGRRAREIIRDLDALPRPAWDLVDVERYRRDLAGAPRLLLDERRDDARLSVPLQLVREADLRPALHGALARARSSTRSPG